MILVGDKVPALDPFNHNYFLGYVNFVSPQFIRIHFPSSILLKTFCFEGEDLNAGLVGSYVAIEGDNYGFLGRIIEVSLPERERLNLNERAFQVSDFHPTGKVEVLLSFGFFDRKIRRGLDQFPPVGAKAYTCPAQLVAHFLRDFGVRGDVIKRPVLFNLATLNLDTKTEVHVSPQSLFGRHCAVVGTTGSGKSNTIARMLEETISHGGKAILIDATGEFEDFAANPSVESLSFNENTHFHYSNLRISDLFILFRPSEQVQLPKLQEAIKSLKLARLIRSKDATTLTDAEKVINITDLGNVRKKGLRIDDFLSAIKHNTMAENLDVNININCLAYQIHFECVFNNDKEHPELFGGVNDRDLGNCQSLITRILHITKLEYIDKVFGFNRDNGEDGEFISKYNQFIQSDKCLLLVSLAKVPFEGNVRETLVNAIGRFLLERARAGEFLKAPGKPVLVFVDEAHQFMNKRIRGDFSFEVELNAFDQIAKECRKYGLFIVLSTQMPRDIPIGTLSQVGTFIAHRLINQQDKEAIENACSSSSLYALSFLPVLGEGEALLMGVDFPMPVIVKITKPTIQPKYKTPVIFGC